MLTRSSRSRLARSLALLLVLALFATACGDDSSTSSDTETDTDDTTPDDGGTAPPTSASTEGENEEEAEATDEQVPVRDGTLRIAVEAESDGLNPMANNFAVSAYVMGNTVFDPLFYVDTDGEWFPYLAESATPVGDGSSWDIKLRPGITFHDGTPLDADALIVNFETVLNDPIISIAVKPRFPEENRYEKIDDLTVRYNSRQPTAAFPLSMTTQVGMVASPAWLAAAAEDPSLDQAPVGTGPFMIESREQDLVTRMVRNENYWQGTENIHLAAVEIHPITDPVIASERVARGELDMVVTSNPDAQLTLEDLGVNITSNLLSGEDDIMMNTSVPPMDDFRVRQALTFAADREGYAELIAQGTKPMADTIFHPDLKWHNPDIVQEGNDPDAAAPLIAEYCADVPDQCTDGKVNIELQFSGPSVTQTLIMDLLIAGWQDYFNVTRQELLQDDHITEVATGAWQVVTWRQFGEIEPELEVHWLQCETAEGLIALNWPRVCNPDRDELLFEQRSSDDEARRIEIWQEIAQDIHDSYAYIFLTHANWVIGFNDNVKNVCGQLGPDGEEMICNSQGRIYVHNAWVE